MSVWNWEGFWSYFTNLYLLEGALWTIGLTVNTLVFGGLIGLIIFIVTVVSIVNNPNHGGVGKFVWILVAFFLSLLGSVLWLIFGRGRVNK